MRIAIPKPCVQWPVIIGGMGAVFVFAPCARVMGQSPAFSINPMRMEMEVSAGTEKTAAFEVKAAQSPRPERGRVILSLTDWTIRDDATANYLPVGSSVRSASPWTTFSPAALTTEPGRTQLVRITVNVPPKTEPGVYRTALFIQDRPDAAPPAPGTRAIHIRVRFAFSLYVIVPPVSSRPELVNIGLDTSQGPPRLLCEMKNAGSGHTRPLLMWSLRDTASSQIAGKGKIEATVLLPFSAYREPYTVLGNPLAPGGYELSVLVDFQDGQPMQSMTRAIQVAVPPPAPPPEVSPAAATPSGEQPLPSGDSRAAVEIPQTPVPVTPVPVVSVPVKPIPNPRGEMKKNQ